MGRLRGGTIVGYLAWLAGTVPIVWLAWSQRFHHERPAFVLLIVWVVVGITHTVVHHFWRACKVSALAAVLVYVVVVVSMGAVNEMLGAGMILVGISGYVLAMAVGIPVALYRRARNDREGERPRA